MPSSRLEPAASPSSHEVLDVAPSVLTEPRRTPDRWALHVALFATTFVTTTLAGGVWASRTALYQQDAWFNLLGMLVGPSFLADGLRFSVPLMLFLTAHEFGHYLYARRYGVDVSPPYFIPLPLPPPMLTFGTMGAVIRLREPLPTTRALFDMGAAGPLAGFVVALSVLVYALATLPPPDYLLAVSPDSHGLLHQYIRTYATFPANPPGGLGGSGMGEGLLYRGLASLFPNVPPPWEMYHYPTLLAAWLGLFFTALNLLPVGQLDGGHVTYALFGRRWHGRIARLTVLAMLALGSLGVVPVLSALADESRWQGVAGWVGLAALLYWLLQRMMERTTAAVLLLALVLGAALGSTYPPVAKLGFVPWLVWAVLLVRIVRVDHPPSQVEEPLTPGRKALAWLCLALLVLCLTLRPMDV